MTIQYPKKKLQWRKDCFHSEGKNWCNCRIRNIRYYLAKKFGYYHGRDE